MKSGGNWWSNREGGKGREGGGGYGDGDGGKRGKVRMGGRVCVDLEEGDCDGSTHKSWSTCRGYGRSELTFFLPFQFARDEWFSGA